MATSSDQLTDVSGPDGNRLSCTYLRVHDKLPAYKRMFSAQCALVVPSQPSVEACSLRQCRLILMASLPIRGFRAPLYVSWDLLLGALAQNDALSEQK